MVDENLYAVRRVFDAFNTGDVAGAVEFIGDGYQNDEFSRASTGQSDLQGPDAFYATVAWLRGAFPDLHLEEQEVISSGDVVVVRGLMTGTQQSEFLGIPPRGKNIASRLVNVFRLEDGKISEHRTFRDDVAVMMQLGAIDLVPATGVGEIYE